MYDNDFYMRLYNDDGLTFSVFLFYYYLVIERNSNELRHEGEYFDFSSTLFPLGDFFFWEKFNGKIYHSRGLGLISN